MDAPRKHVVRTDRAAAGWITSATTLIIFAALLSGVGFAFFRWRTAAPHVFPVLRETAAADPGWLPRRMSAFQAPVTLQRESAAILARVLAALLVCGLVVAAVAFLTLVLTRFSQRRAEFATRAALGETPARSTREIARPIVRSSATGALVGGVGAALLFVLAAANWPGDGGAQTWTRALLGLAGALACALSLAALGVLIVRSFVVRSAIAALLRGGSRTIGSLVETRTRELLVVLQTGACVLLVALAGVFMQSRPRASENGRPTLTTLQVIRAHAQRAELLSTEQRVALLDSVLRHAGSLPGVSAESLASAGSVTGIGLSDRLYSECDICRYGPAIVPFTLVTLRMHAVGPAYFALTETRLLAGREFSDADRAGSVPVVVVNSAFSHRVFGPGNPIGRFVRLQNGMSAPHEIVGLVENTRETALGAPGADAPQVYFSALQYPPVHFDLLVRAANTPALTHQGLTLAAAVPVTALRARAALPVRVAAAAAVILGLLCGLIAVYGLYSTTSGMVSARVHELGVRAALGATPGALVRYAAGRTLRLAVIGIALGFAAAYAAQQVLAGIMPGAELTLRGIAGSGALVLVAALAGVARPAFAAARVDPALALAR